MLKHSNRLTRALISSTLLLSSTQTLADSGGKLLATGGISSFEGSAGGGITPWALIAGYAGKDENNATVNLQSLALGEYHLNSYGAAWGFSDRFEISLQKQQLEVSSGVVTNVFNLLTGGPTPAKIAPGTQIEQTVVGGKVKVFGDAVFSENPYMPQVAVGFQYKKNHDFNQSLAIFNNAIPVPNTGVPALLGATDDSGTDCYISATNVLLGEVSGNNLVYNVTARWSKANTFGLLGFGSAEKPDYDLEMAASLAMFIGTNTLVGAEVRQQTNRLGGLAETDQVHDFFIAYLPSKDWSITAAIVDLGNLPYQPNSKGFYLNFTASL